MITGGTRIPGHLHFFDLTIWLNHVTSKGFPPGIFTPKWSQVCGNPWLNNSFWEAFDTTSRWKMIWLVVSIPLKNICLSVGIIIPIIWKNKNVPNHQPDSSSYPHWFIMFPLSSHVYMILLNYQSKFSMSTTPEAQGTVEGLNHCKGVGFSAVLPDLRGRQGWRLVSNP